MSVPAFIICRDRVSFLPALVSFLEKAKGIGEIVFVDNDSTYPPLLEYFHSTKHRVIYLKENVGPHGFWSKGLAPTNTDYLVTDSDVVPDERCPNDAIEHLGELTRRYKGRKAGLGLRIDNIPDHYARKAEAIAWETIFWRHEAEPNVFMAPLDTTFAIYPKGFPFLWTAIRTGFPYVAQHKSWYEDSNNPTEECIYYKARAELKFTSWEKDELLVHPQTVLDKFDPFNATGQSHDSDWEIEFSQYEQMYINRLAPADAQAVRSEHARFRRMIARGEPLHPDEMANYQRWKTSFRIAR